MNNIININSIEKSDYVPITDEDFDNLDKYRVSTLIKLVKRERRRKKLLLDNIFIRLHNDDDIYNFSEFLVKNDLYNEYILSIIHSDNELYKIHLAVYYDDNYINKIYKNKCNLVKLIYKYGKNYELRGYTYDYLNKLSVNSDYKTYSFIKKTTIKLLKKESLDLKMYRLKELLHGNYLLQFNNEIINENENKKMTYVLKSIDENYNKEY